MKWTRNDIYKYTSMIYYFVNQPPLPSKVKLPTTNAYSSGARFSKAPETFRARKAIFSPSESKTREVHAPETSCMKEPSLHIKNTWIKQLCNHQVRDFAMAFRVRKLFGTFEKRTMGNGDLLLIDWSLGGCLCKNQPLIFENSISLISWDFKALT